MSWTPLHAELVTSTIWREPDHVRIVWITLLALADRYGFVAGSVPGIADIARVSVSNCDQALRRLQEPDEWSRSKEHEGRRIEELDGGYQLLNFAKYRVESREEKRRAYKREWMRAYRARKRGRDAVDGPRTQKDPPEEEAEADQSQK